MEPRDTLPDGSSGVASKETPDRVCPACQRAFVARKRSQRFCTAACQREHHKSLYRRHNPPPPIRAPLAASAIAEAMVCVDLLRRGCEVYRSVVPGGRADLAVLARRRLLLVEVTTGFRTSAGRLAPPGRKRNDVGHGYDVLAIVSGDSITYVPGFDGIEPHRRDESEARIT